MTEDRPEPPQRPFAQIRGRASSDGRIRWIKVDVVDYDRLNDFATWQVDLDDGRRPYVLCYKGAQSSRAIYHLARLVLCGPDLADYQRSGRVNYINGDPTDCRRTNLEWATQSKILAKRKGSGGMSPYKGVSWDKGPGKWVARFRGKNLGRFTDEIQAACAFDDASFDYWGRDAFLNFPLRYDGRAQGESPLPLPQEYLKLLEP